MGYQLPIDDLTESLERYTETFQNLVKRLDMFQLKRTEFVETTGLQQSFETYTDYALAIILKIEDDNVSVLEYMHARDYYTKMGEVLKELAESVEQIERRAQQESDKI